MSKLFKRQEEEINPGGQVEESGRDSAKIRTFIFQHNFCRMVAEQVFKVLFRRLYTDFTNSSSCY